jgi:hypothetical protein
MQSGGASHPAAWPEGFPYPIDMQVGERIRLLRTLLGISQEAITEAISLTFQQVQKYKKGANRAS